MTKEEAIKILTTHNKWRRGDTDQCSDLKQLGIAIDTAIKYLKEKKREVRSIKGV